jgi:hypothetical protein
MVGNLLLDTLLPNHLAIPSQAKRLQGAQNIVCPGGRTAWRINIFHAQQPLPTLRARIKKGTHGRHQRAKMQRPCGRRRKAAAIGQLREHANKKQLLWFEGFIKAAWREVLIFSEVICLPCQLWPKTT